MIDDSRCYFCGSPADLLCGYIVAVEKLGEGECDGRPYPVMVPGESRHFTCDRPLCEGCATDGGTIFCDGESPSISRTDLCPDHAGLGYHDRPPIVPGAEAIQARLLIRLATAEGEDES